MGNADGELQYLVKIFEGYTKDYGIKRLVWFERHEAMDTAILREKRINRWLRPWKYDLINWKKEGGSRVKPGMTMSWRSADNQPAPDIGEPYRLFILTSSR